jgi:hypothetical protein
MAQSPAHRFGQIVGALLEEILAPELQLFCDRRGLYLDRKGDRVPARAGKNVTWRDRFGNDHNLDFVIERGGSASQIGRPLAFIEAAWRRYTKHSRNKAQEIQGAILPIKESWSRDDPFIGIVLAGVFTEDSLAQMRSSGFEVVLFPYETIVAAFAGVGIDIRFDESTPDDVFSRTVMKIDRLSARRSSELKSDLLGRNRQALAAFLVELGAKIDRRVVRIVVLPLHGATNEFAEVGTAISFITSYAEAQRADAAFRKYEVSVRFSNEDKIEGVFESKADATSFLRYVSST